ncbi:MAG: hypothetical protein JOY99_02780 [Sphingomonadaceae bacterium]|nr:hypothetical protein [Sphingomonadaceae bacterium]
MPRAKDFLEPDEVQEPSISEENPPLTPIGSDKDWHETLDAGHEQGPTSTHENKGWRSIKPF